MVSQEDNQSVVNELESKIIQQIEYYFSDINLSRDKFMKELLTKEDGWISLDTLLTFKRLKTLSEDKTVIINALKKSDSNLLEISECLNKIRRSLDKPLPEYNEEYTQDFNERTVHLKGFPSDTKLDDIMKFCKEFGAIENIEMRRHFKSKAFKGCIFVTFINKSDANKVVDSEELKYLDKNLLRENKVNYFQRKKEFNDKKNSKKTKKINKSEDNEAEGGDDDQEEEESGGTDDKPVNVIKEEGAVLKLKGLDDNTKFSDIKKFFQQLGKVAYVEDVQQNQSFVRFSEKNGAKTALEKVKTDQESQDSETVKVTIADKEVTVELLSGEEEIQYWTNFEKTRAQNNKKKAQKKKEFYGKGKRGRGGGNMWQRGKKRGYKGSGDRNGKRLRSEDSD